MAILSGGILGVLSTFSMALSTAGEATRQERAVVLANAQLMRATVIDAASLQPASNTEGPFRWTLTYADKTHGLLSASIVVQWQQRGKTAEYRLMRIFEPRSGSS